MTVAIVVIPGGFRDKLLKTILKVIQENSGIKGVELVMKTTSEFGQSFTFKEYDESLEILTSTKQIREEEYTDPAIPWRVKTRYFPL